MSKPKTKTLKTIENKKGNQLKLMTYNVNFAICDSYKKDDYNSKTSEVIKAILESKADFIFIQESHEGFESIFQLYLSKEYPYQYFKSPENGWCAEGIGMLSKYKVDVKYIQPGVEGSYFSGMIASYQDIQFINIHLRPPVKMGNGSMIDLDNIKILFYESTIIHKNEIEYYIKHSDSEKIIILGDFNEDLSSWMQKKGYSNCLTKSNDRTTWYWPLFMGLYWWNSYDNIFLSKYFSCVDCRVAVEYKDVSDHIPLVILTLFLTLFGFSFAQHKPVIYLHGVLDSYQSFVFYEMEIKKRDPTTKVFALNTFDRIESALIPVFKQVEMIYKDIKKLQKEHNFSEFTFVGFSQGGIVGRALIMSTDLEVANFITIATPAFGEYGLPRWFGLRDRFRDSLRENGHKLMFNPVFQRVIGISWCWNDPKRKQEYLTKNLILPVINNEIKHPKSELFKRNFLKLKKYVIFGSNGDDIVDPWESQFYGMFDENMKMVPLEKQLIYTNDTFGLKTLQKTNRLFIHHEPDVFHLAWVARKDLIQKVIKYMD
eukprot:gene10941-3647_t